MRFGRFNSACAKSHSAKLGQVGRARIAEFDPNVSAAAADNDVFALEGFNFAVVEGF